MLDVNQMIFDAEEKVALYNDLLLPLKSTIMVDTDQVYEPKCIGLLSHWPWYDLMKDWLCELLRLSIDGECESSHQQEVSLRNMPLER